MSTHDTRYNSRSAVKVRGTYSYVCPSITLKGRVRRRRAFRMPTMSLTVITEIISRRLTTYRVCNRILRFLIKLTKTKPTPTRILPI